MIAGGYVGKCLVTDTWCWSMVACQSSSHRISGIPGFIGLGMCCFVVLIFCVLIGLILCSWQRNIDWTEFSRFCYK